MKEFDVPDTRPLVVKAKENKKTGLELPLTLGKPTPKSKEYEECMAMDSCIKNVFTGFRTDTMFSTMPMFVGYGMLSNVSQEALIRAGVETVADEMTRKFIRWTYHADDGKDNKEDLISKMDEQTKKYKLKEIFNEAMLKDGYFGGCLVYIDIGDLDDEEKEEPLILDKKTFKAGSFKGFKVIEPINIYPGWYNTDDPTDEYYFKPKYWYILGKKYHESRFLYFAGNEAPLLLKPTYNFFGIPQAQLALDYVAHFVANREAAQELLNKFSLTCWKTNMTQALKGHGCNDLVSRVKMFNRLKNNNGTMVLDKETEDMLQINTPLSGVRDIVEMSLNLLTAVWRIPKIKYLGEGEGGLNASSKEQMRSFYDYIISQQEKEFTHPLEIVSKIFQLNLGLDINEALSFEFPSLVEMDDKDRANLNKEQADRDAIYLANGVLSQEEVRKRLSLDKNSGYTDVDVDELPDMSEMNPLDGNDTPDEDDDPNGDGMPKPGQKANDEDMAFDMVDGNGRTRDEQGRFAKESGSNRPKEWGESFAMDEFVEQEHPRDEDGRFTEKNTSGSSVNKKETIKKLESLRQQFNTQNGQEAKREFAKIANLSEERLKQMGLSDGYIQNIKRWLANNTFFAPEEYQIEQKRLQEKKEKEYFRRLDVSSKMNNLKLPKFISGDAIERELKSGNVDFKRHIANTGSEYFYIEDENASDGYFVISLRDHYNKAKGRGLEKETDVDIMVDYENKWQEAFIDIADRFGLKNNFVSKVRKWTDLKKSLQQPLAMDKHSEYSMIDVDDMPEQPEAQPLGNVDKEEQDEEVKVANDGLVMDDKWITVGARKPSGDDEGRKGRHILLKDGEEPIDALERVTKKDIDKDGRVGEKEQHDKEEKKEPERTKTPAVEYAELLDKENKGELSDSEKERKKGLEEKEGFGDEPKPTGGFKNPNKHIQEFMKIKKEKQEAHRVLREKENEYKAKLQELRNNSEEYKKASYEYAHAEEIAKERGIQEYMVLRDSSTAKRNLDLEFQQKAYKSIDGMFEARQKINNFEESSKAWSDGVNEIQSKIKDRIVEVSKENEKLADSIVGIENKIPEYKETLSSLWKDYKEKTKDSDWVSSSLAYGDYMNKAQNVKQKIIEEKQSFAKRIGDVLRNKDGQNVGFSKSGISGLEDKFKEVFDGVMAKGMLAENEKPEVVKRKCRAHQSGETLTLSGDTDIQTTIHEFMHYVEEKNPQMLANSVAFLRYRTGNEKLTSLKKLTGISYGTKEKARADKFFDAYCGKIYSFTDDYLNSTATEIMSMGVQELFTNPAKFRKEDPEYFNFVIANLKGTL